MTRSRVFSLSQLVLAALLPLTLCIPWFRLPLLGWEVPIPAWNKAGLACLALAASLMVRAVFGGSFRWVVRPFGLVALYFWWMSPEAIKTWGVTQLAPIQLKLDEINAFLSQMGQPGLDVFQPALWRTLEPETGWYWTGAVLLTVVLVTWFDGAIKTECQGCQAIVQSEDHFCFRCGAGVGKQIGCKNCGRAAGVGDRFCRGCGANTDQVEAVPSL